MIKIKISTDFPDFPIQRQTPGSKGLWGNCQFFVNKDIEECDWWVVYDGLLGEEKVKCPPGNTILITGEPPGVRKYDKRFLNQFATIVTCHRDFNHPNIIYAQQGMPWHVGRRVKDNGSVSYSKDYDELKTLKTFNKEKLISVISSNKTFTQGHKKRFEFVKRLSEHFGSKLDVFGRGIRDVEDKWDAISEYKYHIVLENSACPDYWTEKLSDAFLGGAYPFYYGCPNISEYFPEEALTSININEFEQAVAVIEKAIENHQYEKSINDISTAKSLVLDRYNLFPMLSNICSRNVSVAEKKSVSLKPQNSPSENTVRIKRIMKKLLRKIPLADLAYGVLHKAYEGANSVILYYLFMSDFRKIKALSTGKEPRFTLRWKDRYPWLKDKTAVTEFDRHYVYHTAWAARILAETKPEFHTDISSLLYFVTLLSAFVPVRYYDYRPADINLDGISSKAADLCALPFEDRSIYSLSCMHVVEHVGLGRYGDRIDPNGDLKAISELKRVLALGGMLLFVVPIGKPRIMFNAHRVYSYEQILSYFPELELKEFSLIPDSPDDGGLIRNSTKEIADKQTYGCGCFWFVRSE